MFAQADLKAACHQEGSLIAEVASLHEAGQLASLELSDLRGRIAKLEEVMGG